MKYNIDDMLLAAYHKEYYQDDGKERVWSKAERRQARRKTRRWVPVLVCVLGAVVVMAAVPPVRAAVAEFFASVGEYMSIPKEERPEVEGVVVQAVEAETPVATTFPNTRDETATQAPEGESWTDKVDVTINEAMYDGEVLYLTYTIDGSEIGLKSMRQVGNPGEGIVGPIYNSSFAYLPDGAEFWGYDHKAEEKDGIVTVTTEFSDKSAEGGSIKGLSGKQDLVLKVGIADSWNANGDFSYSGELKIPFTFDADNNMVVKETQTYTINGQEVTFTSVNIKPTEISIDLLYAGTPERAALDAENERLNEKLNALPPEEQGPVWEEVEKLNEQYRNLPPAHVLDIDYEVYLDGEQLHSKWGFIDYVANTGENGEYEGRLFIPFPDQGAKELTLVPYDRGTGERYENDKIVIPLDV